MIVLFLLLPLLLLIPLRPLPAGGQVFFRLHVRCVRTITKACPPTVRRAVEYGLLALSAVRRRHRAALAPPLPWPRSCLASPRYPSLTHLPFPARPHPGQALCSLVLALHCLHVAPRDGGCLHGVVSVGWRRAAGSTAKGNRGMCARGDWRPSREAQTSETCRFLSQFCVPF